MLSAPEGFKKASGILRSDGQGRLFSMYGWNSTIDYLDTKLMLSMIFHYSMLYTPLLEPMLTTQLSIIERLSSISI